MTLIVAAEAADRVGMAEIVGVSAPGDLEIGKDVVLINGERRFTGGLDARGVLTRDRRILRLIKRGQSGGYFLRGVVVARIAGLE